MTEKNGQWKNATILDTDASLVKLQFVDDGTVEWIYLASMRLGPVYQNSLPAKTAGSIAKRRNDNSMQMITIDDDEDGPAVTIEPPAKRSVAKKSTSKAQPSETLPPHASRDQMPPQQPGQAKIKILNDDNIYVDDPARVARVSFQIYKLFNENYNIFHCRFDTLHLELE